MENNSLRLEVARAMQQICQSITNLFAKVGDLKSLPITYRKFIDVGSISEDVVDVTTVGHVLGVVCNEMDKRVTREELVEIINQVLDEREQRTKQKPLELEEIEHPYTLSSLVSASLQKTRS